MTRTTVCLVALAVGLGAAACDSRATASGGGEAAKLGRLARELESCGTTSHCVEGLRCFEQTCLRETRSNLGDFLAARGAARLSAGDVDGAIAAYAEALATYDSEKVPGGVPPDVDCAYGLALVRAKDSKDKAELAARVLHRCLLAVPPGGPLRASALAGLTQLDSAGLDPKQLSKPALADLYLTREPERPATDKLVVTVTADPVPKAKSFADVTARLAQADLKSAFLSCWEKNYGASHAKAMTVHLGIKVSYKPSEYEDEAGVFSLAVTAPAETGGAADAQACVKAAAEPALTGLKTVREAFETTLTIDVK